MSHLIIHYPRTLWRFASGEKAKGYHRVDFQDAWERYL